MTGAGRLRRWVEPASAWARRLPLVWKLLLPGIVVMLVIGVATVVVSTRFLASRVEAQSDDKLFRAGVEVEAGLRDVRLELLVAARTAANLTGVADAIHTDPTSAQQPLAGLAAVNSRVDLLALTDAGGLGLAEVRRSGDGFAITSGTSFGTESTVRDALSIAQPTGDRSGFLEIDDPLLVVVVPVEEGGERLGLAIAGTRASTLVRQSAQRVGAAVSLFDSAGRRVVESGTGAPRRLPALPLEGESLRVRDNTSEPSRAVLFEPLELAGADVGSLAVAVPQPSVADAVRGTALWLALLVLAAMTALAGLSALIARAVTRQVRHVAEVSRDLGRGNLDARADIPAGQELGDLAQRLNDMAAQLQAAQEELEMRVDARTEELRRLHQQSTAATERQSDALAHIGHELRNPIFSIVALTEVMASPKNARGAPGWVREDAKTIRAAAHDLLRQVDDILEASRLRRLPVRLDLDDVSLKEELDKLLPTIRALAQRAQLDLEVRIPSGLPRIRADRVRLRQILLNLASNAVKYTPPKGRVQIAAGSKDGRVSLTVRDTGVGIPPEAFAHLFEPFYRVEGTKAQRGESSSGLGLAITDRLVKAHRGTITVESEPGEGTSFTVAFPVARSRRASSEESRVVKGRVVKGRRRGGVRG